MKQLVKAASSYATTTESDPLALGSLSESDITAEIEDLRAKAKRPTKKTLKLVEMHRTEVCTTYSAIDIGGAMEANFGRYPFDDVCTFNIPTIVNGWNTLQKEFGVQPLPTSVQEAYSSDVALDRSVLVAVLEAAIRAAAKAKLAVASVGYYALMRELEVCLNQRSLPTAGAGLDLDHACEALRFDIFVCQDQKLANNLKSFASGIGRDVYVVTKSKQLDKAIK